MVSDMRRKSCALLLGALLGCGSAAAEEQLSTLDPDPAEAPEESYQPRMQHAAQATEGRDAASILRHVRGAPGTPYGSTDPELDRRLDYMTK
jgi:hypothetical protein